MSGLLWPVPGKYSIKQGFGRPALAVEPTMWLQRDAGGDRRCKPTAFAAGTKYADVHPGVDVACPVGTPIVACEDGKVTRTVTYRIYNPFVKAYVWGRYIEFKFGGAVFEADHLSKFSVPEGTRVARGQTIGRTGDSGVVTGPHIHFEIRQLGTGDNDASSWDDFRWNPERLRVGGDLAGLPWLKP